MTNCTEYYDKQKQIHDEKKEALKRRPQEMKDRLNQIKVDLKNSVSSALDESQQNKLFISIENLIDWKIEQFKFEYDKEVNDAIRSAPTGGPW